MEVLEFPGSVDGPWARYVDPKTVKPAGGKSFGAQNALTPNPSPADGRGGQKPSSPAPSPSFPAVGTVRYPRVVPRDEECAKQLKKRTLTNLYNQRPTWLDLAHKKLDQAVFAAYGWDPGMSDEQLLEKLLALNLALAAEVERPSGSSAARWWRPMCSSMPGGTAPRSRRPRPRRPW